MASRKLRRPRFSVYHNGRGSEPMIVVGITSPAVAIYIDSSFVLHFRKHKDTETTAREGRNQMGERSPLLVRRGGCGVKKISAQPTLAPQTGWSLTSHIPAGRRLFLMAAPIGLAQ